MNDYINWDKLAPVMLANSERWFPNLHETRQGAVVHFALGLAGEVGELVEACWTSSNDIPSELADVVTYTCDIAAALGMAAGLATADVSDTSTEPYIDIVIAAGLIANLVKKANRDANPEAALDSKYLEILTHIRRLLDNAELLAEENEFDLLAAINAKVAICEERWG